MKLNKNKSEDTGQYKEFVEKWTKKQENSNAFKQILSPDKQHSQSFNFQLKPNSKRRSTNILTSNLTVQIVHSDPGAMALLQPVSAGTNKDVIPLKVPNVKRGSSFVGIGNRRMSMDKQLFVNEGRGKIE